MSNGESVNCRSQRHQRVPAQPNVNANPSTPASKNSISKRPIHDRHRLPDQLVHPLLLRRPVPLGVHIDAMPGTRWRPSMSTRNRTGFPGVDRPHHQVHVPGMEPVHDPPAGLVQHDRFLSRRPVTGERPLVELELRRHRVRARLVRRHAIGRREVLRPLVAEIILRRPQVPPVCRRLDALALHRHQPLAHRTAVRLRQQQLDHLLGLVVCALTEVMVANPAPRIDEVDRRPVVVAEGPPDLVVVVHRDRIRHPQVVHRPAHVLQLLLDAELRRMHSDHHQPLCLVLLGPCPGVWQRPEPVDAGVGPEVDQDHLALEARLRERRRVDPGGGGRERCQLARPAHVGVHGCPPCPGSSCEQRTEKELGCFHLVACSMRCTTRKRCEDRGAAPKRSGCRLDLSVKSRMPAPRTFEERPLPEAPDIGRPIAQSAGIERPHIG